MRPRAGSPRGLCHMAFVPCLYSLFLFICLFLFAVGSGLSSLLLLPHIFSPFLIHSHGECVSKSLHRSVYLSFSSSLFIPLFITLFGSFLFYLLSFSLLTLLYGFRLPVNPSSLSPSFLLSFQLFLSPLPFIPLPPTSFQSSLPLPFIPLSHSLPLSHPPFSLLLPLIFPNVLSSGPWRKRRWGPAVQHAWLKAWCVCHFHSSLRVILHFIMWERERKRWVWQRWIKKRVT